MTTDALPTAQINGVVWTQVMIGDLVYAGGEFTSVRPAGAAVGVDETPRKNLVAYDITTGEMADGFEPGAFNGAIKALAVSKDKKTLYVAGDFTRVGSVARGHLAALNATTGALKSKTPSFNNAVNALAVNSKTIYAGGAFTKAGGKSHTRLAAVKIETGKVKGWKAKANATVKALALTAGSKLLVVGGAFTKLNSTAASGSGAVSPSNGKTRTWKVNKVVKNGSKSSAILSLAADGDTVYGSGYTYGKGNFEGVYAASSKDGTVRWLQDCHGDTYDVAPIGDIVYSVGHAHYCSNIGGFPDTNPRSAWYRGLAVTKKAAGTVLKNGQTSAKAYTNFEGNPAPALLNWFPNISAGTYTGMSQGAWSVVGNGTYLAIAGEFPKVDGRPQQGLVRMAIDAKAPNQVGPKGDVALAAGSAGGGAVTLNWNQLWDRDDLKLTYKVTRNDEVIYTKTTSVPFWERSTMSFVDDCLSVGGSPTLKYSVTVSDPDGNTVTSATVSVARPPTPSLGDEPDSVPSTAAAVSSPESTPEAKSESVSSPESTPETKSESVSSPESTPEAKSESATNDPSPTPAEVAGGGA